jgi:hypothetical protein
MKWAALFLLAAVAVTLGDRGHVAFSVLSYPGGGQPLWVLPEMGMAGVGLVWGWQVFPGSSDETRVALRDTAVPALWFLGAYALSSPLSSWPVVLCLGLLGLFVVRAFREPLPRPAVLYCIAVAVGGTVAETIISGLGLFSYTSPLFGPVPIWLPMLYLHVGLATRSIGRAFLPNVVS